MGLSLNSIKTRTIQASAFRTIPTSIPRRHLFDEKINTGAELDRLVDWANLTRGIAQEDASSPTAKDEWHKYKIALVPTAGSLSENLSFLFDQVNVPYSRFTDGSYPVWYGADSIKTSLREILFHLKRTVRSELGSGGGGSLTFERSVCKAKLHLKKNFELTHKKINARNYKSTSSYKDCIKIFKDLRTKGVTSLSYPSARSQDGVCYAVTQSDEILGSHVVEFKRIRVYADGRKSEITSVSIDEILSV